MRLIYIILSLILIILGISGCCQTIKVPYIDKEEYNITVNYTQQELIYEPIKYQLIENKTTKGLLGLGQTQGHVKIKNIDIQTGEFTVEQTFETLNDPPTSYNSTKRIIAGETMEFVQNYESDIGEDVKLSVKVTPVSTIPKTVNVTKSRIETRIRDINKTREEKTGLCI